MTFLTLRNTAGAGALILMAGGLLVGGYMLLANFHDLKRYIRISTM